jgi:signal transduction histidine kinase
MPQSFPTTPRAPRAIRLAAIVIGLAGLTVVTRTTVTSAGWIGRTFPGFMVLDNRVIASVGLGHWSGMQEVGLYQSQVVGVDGAPIVTTRDVYARVAATPPGTAITYRLRRFGNERDVRVASQRFGLRDWFLLFGAYVLNGAAYLAAGVLAWVFRPRAPLARALLVVGVVWSVFLFTAMDLYGPATFFRLHVACEALVTASVLQLALLFPEPHRYARWRFSGYGLAVVVALLYELFLYDASAYSIILYINMTVLCVFGIVFGARLIREYWRSRSPLVRQRVRVVMLGTLSGFSIPAGLVLVSLVTGGTYGMNLGTFSQFLFSLALAYAVVKHDLFEIDAMVKRGAYYLVLTSAVGAAYVGAVILFNVVLKAGAVTDSRVFPVVFTLAVLLVLNPVRARLQAFVDRVFFRTAYDAPRVLAAVGQQLVATLQRERIADLVREAVENTIPNARTRLFVLDAQDRLREVGGEQDVPVAVARGLAEGRVITAFDPAELYADAASHDAVRAGLAGLDAEIAVPLHVGRVLVGVLTAGTRRAGFFYTAGDAEFLRALAHEAAIAFENARSYEALVELNARLEERVRERTAQLESTHRELGEAYAELKSTETQLVHSEKMASLGRLVAGVAHEINNPVSFISTNVIPLRRRLAQAAAIAPPRVAQTLAEAEEITGIMARGAERTAAIVKDLRTFSRLGEATRKPADLHDALEVTLRLLEPRWRGRLTVHRDYGVLPLVECDPGQMNQVFMNILANACDAVTGNGNIWLTTRADGDTVTVTIRDDGAGMDADTMRRMFDPFFTTKDVGAGTGLGLAISHTVVTAHGGRLDVDSAPGEGASFRITLPTGAVTRAEAVGTM